MVKIESSSLLSIAEALRKLEIEDFNRSEILTSSGIKEIIDGEGVKKYVETFYTWGGYSTKVDGFRIIIENGESSVYGSGVNSEDRRDKVLGIRIKIVNEFTKKVIKKFKGKEVDKIYHEIDKRVQDKALSLSRMIEGSDPREIETVKSVKHAYPKSYYEDRDVYRTNGPSSEIYHVRIKGLELIAHEFEWVSDYRNESLESRGFDGDFVHINWRYKVLLNEKTMPFDEVHAQNIYETLKKKVSSG